MDNLLVYSALGLAAFTSLAALYFFVGRIKLQDKVSSLEEKLTLEQAKRTEMSLARAPAQKKADTQKSQTDNQKHAAEIVELRKNNSHLKDEVKQLKSELRTSESLLKEFNSRSEGEMFKLRAENQALIERIRDMESNSADKKRAAILETELTDTKTVLRTAQSELSATQQKLKSERAAADKFKVTAETLQQQVRELKNRIPDVEQEETVKIDPKAFARWKDRALTARQMYKMMRQMRELSDIKLATYQEAVVDVSRTLLTIKGVESPTVAPQENKADRYLAEAWALIQPDTSVNA
ncbi:MAG: hypothetical protein RLZZ488_53 [Pseudomonadota bacterium]|jgi:chromosome segregation ATPase